MTTKNLPLAAIFLPSCTSSPPLELAVCHARQILETKNLVSLEFDANVKLAQVNLIGSFFVHYYNLQRQKLFHKYVQGCSILHPYNFDFLLENEIYDTPYTFLKSLQNGVMSSLASRLRITSLSDIPSGFWLNQYKMLLKESLLIFWGTVKAIRSHDIEILYAFNGRFFDSCAAISAAKFCGIEYCVFDVNRSRSQYYFFNTSLHDIKANQKKAIEHFRNPSPIQLEEAHQYYFDRRNGNRTYEKSYTSGQLRSSLPVLPANSTIISIFPSSDDEIRFLGDSFQLECVDQVNEIVQLASNLPPKRFALIVRMHPNMATMPELVLQRYYDLCSLPNVILVKPLDPIDTYAVLDAATVVVGFCSSIISESAYSGKSTALIGPSPYIGFNMGNEFSSGLELAKFISDDSKFLTPSVHSALVWSSYVMSYNDHLPGFTIRDGVAMVDDFPLPSLRLYRFFASLSKLFHDCFHDTSTLPFLLRIFYLYRRASAFLSNRWSPL